MTRPLTLYPHEARAGTRLTHIVRRLKPQPYSAGSVVSVSEGRWMSCEPSPITGGTRQMDPWRDLPLPPGTYWGRETWGFTTDGNNRTVDYRTDHHAWSANWRSPVTMPRWASRFTITVTAPGRVCRVSEITEAEARGWLGAYHAADEWPEVAKCVHAYRKDHASTDWVQIAPVKVEAS